MAEEQKKQTEQGKSGVGVGQKAAVCAGLDLGVEEIRVLLGACMQVPQARASKEFQVMNGAIMKLQGVLQVKMGARGKS